MKTHISRERLWELAQLPHITGHPEWTTHIRECSQCEVQYIEFVRDQVRSEGTENTGNREKSTWSPIHGSHRS